MSVEQRYAERFVSWVVKNWFTEVGSLLDLGSGKGYHARAFRKLGFAVTEVDLLLGTDLNEARLLCKELFDHIYARSIIEYIKNPFAFANDCYVNLRVGGRMFVLTPDWENMHDEFYGNWRRCSPFTLRSLKMLMEDVGFSTVFCKRVCELPFVWRWTDKAFSTFLGLFGNYIVYVGEKT